MQVQVLSCALSRNVAVFCDVFSCACVAARQQPRPPSMAQGPHLKSSTASPESPAGEFDSRVMIAMVEFSLGGFAGTVAGGSPKFHPIAGASNESAGR